MSWCLPTDSTSKQDMLSSGTLPLRANGLTLGLKLAAAWADALLGRLGCWDEHSMEHEI